MLGPAPVVDFDGTLARLPVAWDDLRGRLRVDRIDEIWRSVDTDSWEIVRDAEVDAAQRASPIEPVRAFLEQSTAFAVLSSNSEVAVGAFLGRFAALESRAAIIVGRESLAGPKRDYAVFARGFAECVDATASARADHRVVYVGDADWELEYARRLGARAVDVEDLSPSS